MELKDLKASLSELSTDELMALVKDVRQSRRTSKRPEPRAKAGISTKKSAMRAGASPSIEDLMARMSPAELLAILQGKGK